jgi:hypothetical protein
VNIATHYDLVALLARHNLSRELEQLLADMRIRGPPPDKITYEEFVNFFASRREMEKVAELLKEMLQTERVPALDAYVMVLDAIQKEQAGRALLHVSSSPYVNSFVIAWSFGPDILHTANFLPFLQDVLRDMLAAKLSPPPSAFTALLQHHLSPHLLSMQTRKSAPVGAVDQLRQAMALAAKVTEQDQTLASSMIQAAACLQVRARSCFTLIVSLSDE